VENRGRKKNLLVPLLRASRGRRRHMTLFKMTLFLLLLLLLFYMNSRWNDVVFPKRAVSFKQGNLFSYFSKLNKEIQANQGHQRGAARQIFQIRFFPSLFKIS
jgi:hypothetical protein